jgi:hypothetical protein
MNAQIQSDRSRTVITIALIALALGLWVISYYSPEIPVALAGLAALAALAVLLRRMSPAIISGCRRASRAGTVALRHALTAVGILLFLPAVIITIRYAITGQAFRYNADSHLAVMAGLCAIAAAIIFTRRRR